MAPTSSKITSSPTTTMRQTLPYSPRQRLTPAGSVLTPMTQYEIELYKNYRGVGTQRLINKRKRVPSKEPDDYQERSAKRHAGDVELVVDHYNLRPEVGVKQRKESPIIGLKNFNNWVKSVLITQFGHPALAAAGPAKNTEKSSIWAVAKVATSSNGERPEFERCWLLVRCFALVSAARSDLHSIDIADVSVEQARQRWETMRPRRFDATFAALDCYTEPLTKAFSPQQLAQPFDVVSMQFCMHYAFETAQKARCMLKNVSEWLRPGGIFLGTIPNADQLLARLDQLPADSEDLSFGNSVYKIRFEERTSRPLFGHRYYFYLRDAVENVPEYIVEWDNFVQMAAQYRLHPVFKKEFHEVFEENREHEDFKQLMVRMNVCDATGATHTHYLTT
ncbi:mRNA capping enzyme-domain-containing protein [Suillus spraguei]|nr:mRNA capping enzyme-domain-containing protein [Suillus spraguei]